MQDFSVLGLFCSAYCSPGSSMLSQIAGFFLRQNNITVCMHSKLRTRAPYFLSIRLSADSCVVSKSWQFLSVTLQWRWRGRYLFSQQSAMSWDPQFYKQINPANHLPELGSGFSPSEASRLSTAQLTPSVQFSRAVVSDSLQPHESQHSRPPCPSQTPRVPGASVRNSAHGKGHEEGGLAYTKAWSSLRKPPVCEHLPQNQSLFYALTYTSDFTGGSPP